MYERTISVYTMSKSYAMTGLRLGYVALADAKLRERMKKALFYTATNVSTIVQYGGIGALEGSQESVLGYRQELQARRDLFYTGVRENAAAIFTGAPPKGAFYAFLKINPDWKPEPEPASTSDVTSSLSWALAEHLISRGRIGCIPGIDFGPNGEGYIRFCFARERAELSGALQSMRSVFAGTTVKR
jgi:aspartate/methionine/tyrosine aminotransferase